MERRLRHMRFCIHHATRSTKLLMGRCRRVASLLTVVLPVASPVRSTWAFNTGPRGAGSVRLQICAADTVCAVNFAGSTGYGYEYMTRLNGHWGDADVRDCVAAAAYLGGISPPWASAQASGTHDATHKTCDSMHTTQGMMLTEDNTPDGARTVSVSRTVPSSVWSDAAWAVAAALAVFSSVHVCEWAGAWATGDGSNSMRVVLGLAAALATLLLRAVRRVHTESITVLPRLGVQLETRRGPCLWRTSSTPVFTCERTFIPRERILDFFMLEAIQRWRIVDYAALATTTQNKLSVVFPVSTGDALTQNLLPPAHMYVHTYRRLHDLMLYGCDADSRVVPRVDASKICLTGRSSGGYTVLNALVHYPHVFCSASCSYGIGDLANLTACTHKFERGYTEGLVGGSPDEIPDIYAARSAIQHAAKIKAPLLLLQGDQDKVVPPDQSRRMAEAIRSHGGHVQYLEFPGEGHGTSPLSHLMPGFRDAATRRRALEAEYAWCSRAALSDTT